MVVVVVVVVVAVGVYLLVCIGRVLPQSRRIHLHEKSVAASAITHRGDSGNVAKLL